MPATIKPPHAKWFVGGTLNVSEAATDANGTARVTFTAGSADGSVTVLASADHADDVSVTVLIPNEKGLATTRVEIRVPSELRVEILYLAADAEAVSA